MNDIPKELILGHNFIKTLNTDMYICNICEVKLFIFDNPSYYTFIYNNETYTFSTILPSIQERFRCCNLIIRSIIE